MKGTYFVTGATGNVGRQVVRHLASAGHAVLGAGRPGSRPESEEGVRYIDFDFTDPDTWRTCLDGVDGVFLMRPPHIGNIKKDMEPFMQYMKTRGVGHVVFMSVQGAEHNRLLPHNAVEQACKALDLPATIIRPSFFMQNLTITHLVEIRDERTVYTPTGEGRTNFIDARDIGDIAARILLDPSHIGKAYTVTGARSYSYGQVAEELSVSLDDDIRFANPGPIWFIAAHLRKGRSLKMTLVMLFLYTTVKLGRGDITTNDAESLLGRPPRSLRDFLADYKGCLSGNAA